MAISVGVTANGGDFTQIYNMQDATDNDAEGSIFGTIGTTNITIFVEGTAGIPYQAKGAGHGWAGMWNNSNSYNIANNHLRIAVSSLDPFQTEGHATGGVNMRVSQTQGGATNWGEWEAGGQDTLRVKIDNFIHLCIDTSRTYDSTGGTPSLTACKGFYGGGTMQSGSGQNTFLVDNISYGEKIQVYGGTAIAPGTSAELAAVTQVREHGAFLDVGGVYYLLAGIDFGETGTASSYFKETGQVWNCQGQNVANDLYRFTFEGNATGTNSFDVGTKSGTGKTATGVGGNTVIATQAPFSFDVTDANFDEPYFYGWVFKNSGHTSGTHNITAANAEYVSCLFDSNSKITIANSPLYVNNTIADSVVASTEAAIDLGTSKPSANTFANIIQSGCNAHGLRISGTSTTGDTWDLDNIAMSSNTTADILVDYPAQTSGKVTINLNNGSAANSTTQVAVTGGIALIDVDLVQSVSVTVTVLDEDTDLPINLAHVQIYLTSDYSTVVLSGATNASGIITGSYGGTTPAGITGWARQMDISGTDYVPKDFAGSITSTGFTLTVKLKPLT